MSDAIASDADGAWTVWRRRRAALLAIAAIMAALSACAGPRWMGPGPPRGAAGPMSGGPGGMMGG